MLIDKSHRPWAVVSAAILAVSIIVYVPYALRPIPPRGGSALGLTYGIVGFGFMLFVTLLSVRKKFPIWRIGRTQTWMRGHLWLGALSLPLILLHAGFLLGHGLTSWLMWIFVIVWTSGLVGAWLQHMLPRRLLREVPMETISDQIGRVREQLVGEADTVIADACGRLEVATAIPAAAMASGSSALDTVMRPVDSSADDTGALREFYVNEMRPFLERPSRVHPLADAERASERFARLRPFVPSSVVPAIDDLDSICEEERQLLRQQQLQRLLQGWLLVHVPLSFALMTLAVVHIVMALRF